MFQLITLPGFYSYFEERAFGGGPSKRFRDQPGILNPGLIGVPESLSFPSTYPWWKARELEGRSHVSEQEGTWPISHCRTERHYGDPLERYVPFGIAPSEWPENVEELAGQCKLHHYFRTWNLDDCRSAIIHTREARVSLEIGEEWFEPEKGRILDPSLDAAILGSHAVPVMGYDVETERLHFLNSWGGSWGDGGYGSITKKYFEDRLVESWVRVGGGIIPRRALTTGIVSLLWKSTYGGREVHGREIIVADGGAKIGWAFLVKRNGFLDIEELFVWPSFRSQGYGRELCRLIVELARGVDLPLRARIPFADCESDNRTRLEKTLRHLGLQLRASPHRSAGFLATTKLETTSVPEPRIPLRPASIRDALNPEVGTRQYTVWFGTNRRPINPDDLTAGFSGERDVQVYYGKCYVAIPRSRKFGSVGSAWWKRWIRLTDDQLKIISRRSQSQDEFWGNVKSMMQSYPNGERQALIFLHGYRTRFDQAAIRAAQLGFDLKVPGVTALFSWPSMGSKLQYPYDGESIQASESHISDFLMRFAQDTGAERVHLIAHSMGNRGLIRSMQRITSTVKSGSGVKFGQIILAAPDVDRDVFLQLASVYPTIYDRTTLYVSPSDQAVSWSKWIHDSSRVGLTPPVTVMEGIDTIEIPRLDITNWRWHSYFAEGTSILHDIYNLIHHNSCPAARQRLSPMSTDDGARYWAMDL